MNLSDTDEDLKDFALALWNVGAENVVSLDKRIATDPEGCVVWTQFSADVKHDGRIQKWQINRTVLDRLAENKFKINDKSNCLGCAVMEWLLQNMKSRPNQWKYCLLENVNVETEQPT